ncbi:adenosine kinase [Microlunatus endophyticus]|uniref:Adenosine kinase n=1 Tax=Microlunatus endophyticus TaxID=1716077 RepID=A0A917S7B7_9ACTN|nr:carbohydrate kinase family protein [Microlunatus endophyticus]GGL61946.1 adenosine kinase [Microlunatus endophyticus]
MQIAVTGSIATDHLMQFPGRFTDSLVDGKMETVSLSFLADQLDIHRGGVAANISFTLGCLGMSPILAGAVGADFDIDYRPWLEEHGVDTKSVYVSSTHHTARFVCTTDRAQNQIATFYAGAMQESGKIELKPIEDRLGQLDLVVIAASDPDAMITYTAECVRNGYPFAADVSQQLAIMDGDGIRKLVSGAKYLFTNQYESELLMQKTGWSKNEVLGEVGLWIITQGAQGVSIESTDGSALTVGSVPVDQVVDPTGGGDAFRAGFLWGLDQQFPLERAAQVGCATAALALQTVGPQDFTLDRHAFVTRIGEVYGEQAALDVRRCLLTD